jgi:hypothetical protein
MLLAFAEMMMKKLLLVLTDEPVYTRNGILLTLEVEAWTSNIAAA